MGSGAASLGIEFAGQIFLIFEQWGTHRTSDWEVRKRSVSREN